MFHIFHEIYFNKNVFLLSLFCLYLDFYFTEIEEQIKHTMGLIIKRIYNTRRNVNLKHDLYRNFMICRHAQFKYTVYHVQSSSLTTALASCQISSSFNSLFTHKLGTNGCTGLITRTPNNKTARGKMISFPRSIITRQCFDRNKTQRLPRGSVKVKLIDNTQLQITIRSAIQKFYQMVASLRV